MATTVPRSTMRESWGWVWPDVLLRVLPFWLVPLAMAHWFLGGPRAVGVAPPPYGWGIALLIGLAVGIPMLGLAIAWRRVIAPRYRLPTTADQTLQTIFYLVINAPAEEVFWRGLLQTQLIRAIALTGWGRGWSIALGIVVIAVLFGAYHRLGNYPWRFNIAAMGAGLVFGALYALLPGPSIIVASIVHGLTTAGFLSWGDVALHWMRIRRLASASRQSDYAVVRVDPGQLGPGPAPAPNSGPQMETES